MPPTTPCPPMPSQIEGSRAVAETVALCRPEVIGAYPISPQTHIVEALSSQCGYTPTATGKVVWAVIG